MFKRMKIAKTIYEVAAEKNSKNPTDIEYAKFSGLRNKYKGEVALSLYNTKKAALASTIQ